MSLTLDDFDFVRELATQQLGMALENDQQHFVTTRLSALARRLGMSNVEILLAGLRNGSNRTLQQEACEALVTHETSFFRDPHYFDELSKRVIPSLIESRIAQRQLTIWCAACSTGQEVYSLAMILREQFNERLRGWRVDLLASDFSSKALQQAKAGHFSDVEMSRGLTPARQAQHFRRDTSGWLVDEQLQRMIRFERINLLGPWPDIENVDLVLLRNVLIYMHPTSRQRVIQKLARVLHPHGVVMLGSTEAAGSSEISCIRPS